MKAYKYKWIHVENQFDSEKVLNYWGRLGWVLVAISGSDFYMMLEYHDEQ